MAAPLIPTCDTCARRAEEIDLAMGHVTVLEAERDRLRNERLTLTEANHKLDAALTHERLRTRDLNRTLAAVELELAYLRLANNPLRGEDQHEGQSQPGVL